MKGLLRKIFTPLVLAGALSITNPVSAQENNQEAPPGKPFIAASIGILGGSQIFQDIYGSMARWRIAAGADFFKNLRLEGAVVYRGKEIEGSYKWRNWQWEAIIHGMLPLESVIALRLGVGFTSAFMESTVIDTQMNPDTNISTTKVYTDEFRKVGPVIVGGVDIMQEYGGIYGEVSWDYLPEEIFPGEKVNFGGLSFNLGLRIGP